jgi:glycosyltransferase involved in cell wall biosynthesis
VRALVVIPTYNERDNLPRLLAQARAALPTADLLIVDDSSPDGTGALAEAHAAADERIGVLHRPAKAGLGSAYRVGFAWGLERGYEAFVEMDADLSHNPTDLPRLVGALTGADLVVGSRYVPQGAVVDWPRSRLALSRGGNRFVQLATGLPLADATSGFRAFRREVVTALGVPALRSEGYCFQVETALRAWQAGFRIVELPITFVERRLGQSKISRRIVLEAVLRTLVWGLAGPRRAAPVHPASVAAP